MSGSQRPTPYRHLYGERTHQTHQFSRIHTGRFLRRPLCLSIDDIPPVPNSEVLVAATHTVHPHLLVFFLSTGTFTRVNTSLNALTSFKKRASMILSGWRHLSDFPLVPTIAATVAHASICLSIPTIGASGSSALRTTYRSAIQRHGYSLLSIPCAKIGVVSG